MELSRVETAADCHALGRIDDRRVVTSKWVGGHACLAVSGEVVHQLCEIMRQGWRRRDGDACNHCQQENQPRERGRPSHAGCSGSRRRQAAHVLGR